MIKRINQIVIHGRDQNGYPLEDIITPRDPPTDRALLKAELHDVVEALDYACRLAERINTNTGEGAENVLIVAGLHSLAVDAEKLILENLANVKQSKPQADPDHDLQVERSGDGTGFRPICDDEKEQCSQCGEIIEGYHSCQGVPGGFGDDRHELLKGPTH